MFSKSSSQMRTGPYSDTGKAGARPEPMFPDLLRPRCDAGCLKEPARAAASSRSEKILSALRVTVFPRLQLGLLRRQVSLDTELLCAIVRTQ